MMPITSGLVPEHLDGRIPWSAKSLSIAVLQSEREKRLEGRGRMENVKCQSSKSKWQMTGFKPRARHDPLAWSAVRRLSRRIGGHRSAVFGLNHHEHEQRTRTRNTNTLVNV